jgi:hypothetical protein
MLLLQGAALGCIFLLGFVSWQLQLHAALHRPNESAKCRHYFATHSEPHRALRRVSGDEQVVLPDRLTLHLAAFTMPASWFSLYSSGGR